MKKRILSIFLIETAMITMFAAATGCGPVGNGLQNNSMSSSVIHAKELTGKVGIAKNIDYAEPSMQPVQQFAYDLLLYNLEEANPVISPVSAYVALCMLANGAQGETKEELQHVLGEDLMCLPDQIMNILPQNSQGTHLKAANSIWIDEAFVANDDWLGTIKSLFDASVYQADLDTDLTRQDINQWVSDHTNQMIPELLDKNLDGSAKLALVNALYFRADWMSKFDAGHTMKQIFYLEDGSEKEVSMMYQLYYDCAYLKDESTEGVILPYADSNYAFVALKPLGDKNIREWYSAYSVDQLFALLAGREMKDIELGLVKFTAGCRKNLNESLIQMGASRMFDMDLADFSRIGSSKEEGRLFVNRVLQEAVIQVAEDGTEASAATIVDMADGGGMIDAEQLTFDSPFLYVIMDMEHEMPVFMGIVDQPEESL